MSAQKKKTEDQSKNYFPNSGRCLPKKKGTENKREIVSKIRDLVHSWETCPEKKPFGKQTIPECVFGKMTGNYDIAIPFIKSSDTK